MCGRLGVGRTGTTTAELVRASAAGRGTVLESNCESSPPRRPSISTAPAVVLPGPFGLSLPCPVCHACFQRKTYLHTNA